MPRDSSVPDIVIGSSPHLFGALGAWGLARRHRATFVLEVRDVWPESLVELMGLSRRHPLVLVLTWVEKFLYRRADLIVGVLEGVAERVTEVVGEAAPPVIWVPNGVELDGIPIESPRGDPGNFNVIYAGAHGVPNALDVLLEAAQFLRQAHHPDTPDIHIRLIGDGRAKDSLEEYAAARDLTNVSFEGLVSKHAIHRLLLEADAFVLPGRKTMLYRYGASPNKLFDYMACGRPVVFGLDMEVNPVSVSGGGVAVPPEDPTALGEALVELARMDPRRRAEMGSRAREYVQEHHDVRRLASVLAGALLRVHR